MRRIMNYFRIEKDKWILSDVFESMIVHLLNINDYDLLKNILHLLFSFLPLIENVYSPNFFIAFLRLCIRSEAQLLAWNFFVNNKSKISNSLSVLDFVKCQLPYLQTCNRGTESSRLDFLKNKAWLSQMNLVNPLLNVQETNEAYECLLNELLLAVPNLESIEETWSVIRQNTLSSQLFISSWYSLKQLFPHFVKIVDWIDDHDHVALHLDRILLSLTCTFVALN